MQHNHNRQPRVLTDLPFHLIFPTPIPEPPRVINSRPLVSDISDTSVVSSIVVPPARLKHRRPLSIRQRTRAKQSDTSSDDEDEEDEHRQQSLPLSKQAIEEDLVNRLTKVKQNLKSQQERLPVIKSKLLADSNDIAATCSPTSTSSDLKEMLEYVKQKDIQLEEINSKIDKLLQFQHMQLANKAEDNNKQGSPQRITINQQHNVEYTAETANGAKFVQKRSVQTSFMADPSRPNDISPNFLDSSIEKARRELQTKLNLVHKAKECTPRIVSKQTRPKTLGDYQQQQQHSVVIEDVFGQHEDRQQRHNNNNGNIFDRMLHNISEILERNSSIESSSPFVSTDGSSSLRSNGHRSSCSNTPTSESNFITALSVVDHSSPRRPARGAQHQIPTKGRLVRSEQSMYIHKLVQHRLDYSEDEADDIVLESSYHPNKQPQHQRGHRPRPADRLGQTQEQINRLLLRHERDYNLQTYGFAHEASIATKEYLDKYGLTCRAQDKLGHRDCKQQQQHIDLPKDKMVDLGKDDRVDVVPNKRNNPVFDRILDLQAIKSLPKLN